jgi:non-specific serine/threonine protein kinase/serine/threonine-protein kinase
VTPGAKPVNWSRVKQIFAEAVEGRAADRAAFLAAACGGDDALRREVESLLASHEAAEEKAFIQEPPAPELAPEAPPEGQRLGPYRLLGEIGRGGMGTVFRAVRDDDQYRKVVAIKLGQRGLFPSLALRLKGERQILAGLDHPGIARLLDGGAMEGGLPYLVMEYVEGVPITDHVQARGLPLRDRLRLFRDVCAAVHHAHQKLVVHRDIKPGNILVTPEGVPKLLDFGIAKLLASESPVAAPTATAPGPMTPEYASPEQVQGEAITTATDVYSLGVLLCEILSGERPYRFSSREPHAIARVIVTAEPERPSALVARGGSMKPRPRQLRGDLDNIVLMALRKEPQRRYASADQLSEDVRRHLEGRPVIARPDTFGYRASKFVGRNRGLVAAAAGLVLALVAGIGATAWETRVARRERARADLRLRDVRAIANSLLFEFNDAIEKLPGSAPARQLLVTRGLEYIDRLARESGGDAALERELARGYLRLGDLQRRLGDGSPGNAAGALASYRKSLSLSRSADAAEPENDRGGIEASMAMGRIGTLLANRGNAADDQGGGPRR